MTRNILVCLGFAIAFAATTGEARAGQARAEPLCEPELAPELCIPGISTSPECWVHDPAGAPAAGGTISLWAPELVLPASLPAPAPGARRRGVARFTIGAPHPGYARGIDRPPQRIS